ncbi:gluconate 2-dehydrogenase subunit 3 family protein [Chitinophaga qingshengii]|uniref:Gluconate 2-dehydrogenase subunit 3 family protein n=1 Tax=Chitinophaga qingshengii TaxID=1569794 RepID=A0ABR7TQR9_9BACT|nr:gluconate 2-dehydrogenase subunit 3 family protein [Chitinophaga qingshengii]MBC9931975.1 gluconate 2-dehydrogenase subunit 3 family protein [Chitinophaga qingshengii]
MNRREALSYVGILLGGTIIGADAFLAGCKPSVKKEGLFQPEDLALLDEIAETIIPATPDSGGGKAAGLTTFMSHIITDCYTENERNVMLKGIDELKKDCLAKHKKDFINLTRSEKEIFLTQLHEEALRYVKTDAYMKAKETFDKQQDSWVKSEKERKNFGAAYLKENFPPHYFTMMRQLTLWGYFSSEVGMTKALRYMDTPGHYDGAYPYKKGDKAWAI